MPLNQFDLAEWTSQPLDRLIQPNPRWVERGLDFLSSGNSQTVWMQGRSGVWPSSRAGEQARIPGRAVGVRNLTFGNGERERLHSSLPITTLIIGGVLGTLSSTDYPLFFSFQSQFATPDRGGYEVGIGGDLGEGSADIGRIYSVVRGAGYLSNERLIKVTTPIVVGQRVFITHRMTAAAHELDVFGVGSVSGTTATPGVNAVDPIQIGTFSGSAQAYCELVARFRAALTDGEIASIRANPWQLVEPDRIWVPVSAGAPNTAALTGNQSTSARGIVVPSLSLATTGNQVTASVGTLTASTAINVAITGNVAATAVGIAVPSISLPVTGVQATASSGIVSPDGSVTLALTGNVATSAVGALTLGITVPITGVQATASSGLVTPPGNVSAALTGVGTTASVGTLTAALSLGITGVASTSAAGTVTPASGNVVALTGNGATSAVGIFTHGISLALTGRSATASIGSLGVGGWQQIDDSQTPNWVQIVDAQTPNWTPI